MAESCLGLFGQALPAALHPPRSCSALGTVAPATASEHTLVLPTPAVGGQPKSWGGCSAWSQVPSLHYRGGAVGQAAAVIALSAVVALTRATLRPAGLSLRAPQLELCDLHPATPHPLRNPAFSVVPPSPAGARKCHFQPWTYMPATQYPCQLPPSSPL